MKKQSCGNCASPVFFENSACLHCGTALRYSRDEQRVVTVDSSGTYTGPGGVEWHSCVNLELSACTWLTAGKDSQCFSCELTRTRPNDADAKGLTQFAVAERAKRHLIAELDALRLPIITRREDPEKGLAFDLLSSVNENVTIGHANGIITIDLAESEDAYRERMRAKLDEPYRTMLGHFRHEVGHYFEGVLVFGSAEHADQARTLFGDDTQDYGEAIDRHYSEGAPAGWEEEYISRYATMHPYEDFAETFAHYLHIQDTLETAREFGLVSAGPDRERAFTKVLVDTWVPLSIALNQVNRSMGMDDLYPFVIPPAVIQKLDFVHSLRA